MKTEIEAVTFGQVDFSDSPETLSSIRFRRVTLERTHFSCDTHHRLQPIFVAVVVCIRPCPQFAHYDALGLWRSWCPELDITIRTQKYLICTRGRSWPKTWTTLRIRPQQHPEFAKINVKRPCHISNSFNIQAPQRPHTTLSSSTALPGRMVPNLFLRAYRCTLASTGLGTLRPETTYVCTSVIVVMNVLWRQEIK
ncbi:hypothetical protein K474DRAFT_1660343 [Panus rudis PR-1116 ss-1]|nr:hypothetical protein K474DRAFT_1660343 [Panus rudis PR-1116 ss-1]